MKHFFSRCLFSFCWCVYGPEMQISESRSMSDKWRQKNKLWWCGIFCGFANAGSGSAAACFCISSLWEVLNVRYFGPFKIIMAHRNCFLKKKIKLLWVRVWLSAFSQSTVPYCKVPYNVDWGRMTSRWSYGGRMGAPSPEVLKARLGNGPSASAVHCGCVSALRMDPVLIEMLYLAAHKQSGDTFLLMCACSVVFGWSCR